MMNPIWQEIRDQLEQEKQRVTVEIRRYPAPIPACDVQFNYLMQQRATITRELGQLETAVQLDVSDTVMLRSIDEFIRGSICLGVDVKWTLSNRLRDMGSV